MNMRFAFLSILFFSATVIFYNCENKNKTELQTATTTSFDQIDSMIILYTENIQDDSSNINAFLERSKLYERQNKMLLAISDMEKVVELEPSNTENLNKLASLYFQVTNKNKAIETYVKTLEFDNANEEALLNLGKIHYILVAEDTTNRNISLAYLYNVVKINTTNTDAFFFIAQNYLEEGDTVKAINALVKSVDANPDFYEGYIQLGLLHANKKDIKAIDYYNNALRIDPKSTEVHYNLGYFYQSVDSFNKAESWYRKLLDIDKTYKSTNYNLAYILFLKEKYEEAIKFFNESIKKDPANIDAYYGRGLCFKSLGNTEQAKKDFEKALEINPSDELIRKELNSL
jgi:tetratricopeptide (TPR) repeat protein